MFTMLVWLSVKSNAFGMFKSTDSLPIPPSYTHVVLSRYTEASRTLMSTNESAGATILNPHAFRNVCWSTSMTLTPLPPVNTRLPY